MDKNLTDNEIVKALECCCEDSGCPAICPLKDMAYVGDCVQFKSKSALDLINRQNAEIERLQERCIEIQRCDKELIETLNKIHEEKIQTAKAESYKECIEKLKSIFGEWIYDYKTEDLLKELVGENDG